MHSWPRSMRAGSNQELDSVKPELSKATRSSRLAIPESRLGEREQALG
jgi:hypothetical protein